METCECPGCGEPMTEVTDMGYRYMRCKCGEEVETANQRVWNDRRFKEEEEW